MSQTVTLNGVSYTVPEENDNNWGGYTTTYLVAIASNMLQKSGGAFNLTADVDFGSTYGLIAGYYKSASANIASAGVVRLSNTDDIAFRNAANSGDLLLSADPSSDGILTYNSVALVTLSATQTLTNKTLTSPTLTSPVLNTSVSGSAIDTDLASVSSSDDTLASAKAIKTYVDAQVTAADLDFSGDSGGAQSVDLDSQSLTIEGGTGVDTTGSAQKISIAIDSTVATLTGSQALTNKTIDVDSNTVSNIEVDNLKSGVLDTDIAGGVSGSDDTLASAKAIKTYVDAQVTAQDLDFSGDSGGAQNVDLDSQSLTVSGGTGIDTTGSAQTMTIAIDSTVATLTGSQALTNKTIDVDSNTVSNIEVDNLKSGVLDTDIAGGVSSSDDTLASAKAIKTYVDAQVTAQDLDFSGDSGGAQSVDLDSQSLTVAGGTGIDTTGSAQTMTVAIDSTVATLAGSQTLTNKTLTGANVGTGKVTDYLAFDHQGSDPGTSPDSNDVFLYAKENKLYYKDSNDVVAEVGSGGGAGDADTIQLKAANDFSAVNVAPWYTGSNPVPGGGGSLGGTFEISTSNPLINTDDKTNVFRYTNGTSNRKNDYFEIELDVPNYAKGKNLVVQLFYRTVGAEDTDFLFFARDRTADYETTTSSSGALNTITLASATGFAVGDRICIQDSSDARHFRYVTAVSGSDITFSGSAITVGSGDVVVSKYFTDELDTITAENNTTNYEGKIRKWAFKINDTTTKIRVGFIYDNSATTTNELFFDQILLSSNQFLQASSQLESSKVMYHSSSGYGSDSNNKIFKFTNELSNNIPSSVATIDNNSASGFSLTANAKIKVSATLNFNFSSSGTYAGWSLNASSVTTNLPSLTQSEQVGMAQSMSTNGYNSATASIIMEKGDILRPHSDGSSVGTADRQTMQIVVTPVENDVVLLNSQDEIFTDWTEFDATLSVASGSPPSGFTTAKGRWRRVGSSMDIAYTFVGDSSTVTGTGVYLGNLPSGYSIDMAKIQGTVAGDLTSQNPGLQGFAFFDDTSNHSWYQPLVYNSTQFYMNGAYHGGNNQPGTGASGPSFGSSNKSLIISLTNVPIAGWSSTFNPVLSMPLVDFGSLENSWSCLLGTSNNDITQPNNGPINTTSISSGVWTVTYKSGFFGSSPVVAVSPVVTSTANPRYAYVNSVSSTGFTIVTVNGSNGSNTTSDISGCVVTITRNSTDFIKPPQPTAAVIKPAVAIISNTQSSTTYQEGQFGGSNAWVDRVLNTIKGESWFIDSLSSNTFTLQAGMYKVFATAPAYYVDNHRIQLYDNTNSATKIMGTIAFSASSYNGLDTAELSGVFTITSATAFKIKHINSYNYANDNALGHNSGAPSNAGESVFTSVTIEKLK